MMDNEIQRVIYVSGFSIGSIPFNYLGVWISTTKLKKKDWQPLIIKMVNKINVWSSMNLLFAARGELVNSVLMSIHVYLWQLFILPKSVLKEVNNICISFLWTRTSNDCKFGAIAWDDLCKSKSTGGLGFRNILKWNVIVVFKLAWCIDSKKDNHLVKWVNYIYIKDTNWSNYEASSYARWVWKFVCAA